MVSGKSFRGGRSDDDDDDQSDEETDGPPKGKKVKRKDYYCPPSCFTLSLDEIAKLMKCLLEVKVPKKTKNNIIRTVCVTKQNIK